MPLQITLHPIKTHQTHIKSSGTDTYLHSPNKLKFLNRIPARSIKRHCQAPKHTASQQTKAPRHNPRPKAQSDIVRHRRISAPNKRKPLDRDPTRSTKRYCPSPTHTCTPPTNEKPTTEPTARKRYCQAPTYIHRHKKGRLNVRRPLQFQ